VECAQAVAGTGDEREGKWGEGLEEGAFLRREED
jgi:hypothetical protein